MADSILDKVLSSKHAEEISHFSPQEIMNRLLSVLPSRERNIIVRRYGFDGQPIVTLEEIGKSLEVTRERVRQIERGAIAKMKQGPLFSSNVVTIEHVIRQYLEDAGGALREDELYARLVGGRDHPKEARSILTFALRELLADRFQRIAADDTLHEGWALRSFSLDALLQQLRTLTSIIEEVGNPMPLQLIFETFRRKQSGTAITEEQLLSSLELSAVLQKNAFGEWGLVTWVTVHPRRMRDKIYLILKRHGKPLHFNDITRLINETNFDQKVAHPPTVHNELIMDKRFVLVGRGMYALAEWGYKPGIVADVVADVLREAKDPMSREAIVRAVLAQRMVGKATVHLALMNRERFTKLPDGRYTLITKTSSS